MNGFYPPHFKEERKESPGESAVKWGGYLMMSLRYIDFEISHDLASRIVLACQINFNRWKRKFSGKV